MSTESRMCTYNSAVEAFVSEFARLEKSPAILTRMISEFVQASRKITGKTPEESQVLRLDWFYSSGNKQTLLAEFSRDVRGNVSVVFDIVASAKIKDTPESGRVLMIEEGSRPDYLLSLLYSPEQSVV